MRTARRFSIILAAFMMMAGGTAIMAKTGESLRRTPASPTGIKNTLSTVKLCWVIQCTGTSGVCYAWGDVFGGQFMVEPGRMSRFLISCPTSTPHGTRHTRVFAVDPNDPTGEAGYGCTQCDAWVDGANATVTEYEDSPTQTTFTDWKNSK